MTGDGSLKPAQLDRYVLLVLQEKGWFERRRFPLAEEWVREIEAGGCRCFEAARDVLRSLGGFRFRENSPCAGLYFLERRGDWNRLAPCYRKPLERLKSLGLEDCPKKYTGASFDFFALDAYRDREIVLPFEDAERIAGEVLFPIGAVEPDGISCVSESGRVYTLFDDSVFRSGNSIEDYLNGRFLRELVPELLYKRTDRT